MLPRMGEDFGPYRITGRLGQGGMGVVFSAVHRDLERSVALKIMAPELSEDESFRNRFLREARALGRVDSPHLIKAYDAGERDGWLFIATELVPDGDLTNFIPRDGLPAAAAIDLVRQTTEGIAAAHDAGVLHRDIKPSNVLIRRRPNGEVRAVVCDLGISAVEDEEHTQTQGIIGTPTYMAPERHEGQPATVATDIYSLGCLLWAALTGRPPYVGTAVQVLFAHLREPVPQLPLTATGAGPINVVLAKAMAKAPADRYATARQLADALAAVEFSSAAAPTAVAPPLAEVRRTSDDAGWWHDGDTEDRPVLAAPPPPTVGATRPPAQPAPTAPVEEDSGVVVTIAGPTRHSGTRAAVSVLTSLLVVAVLAGFGVAYATGRLGFGPLSTADKHAADVLADSVRIGWLDEHDAKCASRQFVDEHRAGGLRSVGLLDGDSKYHDDVWTARLATAYESAAIDCLGSDWASVLAKRWKYGDQGMRCLAREGPEVVASVLGAQFAAAHGDDTADLPSGAGDITECVAPAPAGVDVIGTADHEVRLRFHPPLGPTEPPEGYSLRIAGSSRNVEFDDEDDARVRTPGNGVYRAEVVPLFDIDGKTVRGGSVVVTMDPWAAPGKPTGTGHPAYRAVDFKLHVPSNEAKVSWVEVRRPSGWHRVGADFEVGTREGGLPGCATVRSVGRVGRLTQHGPTRTVCGRSEDKTVRYKWHGGCAYDKKFDQEYCQHWVVLSGFPPNKTIRFANYFPSGDLDNAANEVTTDRHGRANEFVYSWWPRPGDGASIVIDGRRAYLE
ncbi:serine/threonine-protein kinase [Nocardioides sp. MH1]|uniref:serine/threonine-protein kinase n=1 Tax=Nocardioides sp. MH1 TaxID=3242490 RepID=UPI0035207D04